MTPAGLARALRRPHIAALAASLAVHLAVAAAAYVDGGRPAAPAVTIVPVEIVAAIALAGEPAEGAAAAGGAATPIERTAGDGPPVSAEPGAAAAPEAAPGTVGARAPPRPRPRPPGIRTALAPAPALDRSAPAPLPRARPSAEPPRPARPLATPPAAPEHDRRAAGANAAVGAVAPPKSAARAPSAPRPDGAGPAGERGERGKGRGAAAGAPALRPRPGNPAPVYPRTARERGWQGRVVLRVAVDADGSVARADIEETSGHPVLDRAALGAVRRWRFMAGTGSLPPPGAVVRVPIAFRLDAARSPTNPGRGP